ncbi:hit zinc finger [Colletotrichum musicola]|uniref:Hit zinc finger n=1 Tax=Colletotrichum musicola TaxID=2175873 RepID=A0A8H6NTZ1_9PEZI|nr:hit zinc finger [Colletotrichum musicola]
MATAENEAPAAPASPKRAQDEVDELLEPPSKRSKTVSPEPEQEAPVEGRNDEAEVVTESTTGAAAEVQEVPPQQEQEQKQKQEEPPKEQEPAAPAAASEPASAPAPAPAPADDTPETKAPKTKMCGICHEKEGKYKCARCALPLYVAFVRNLILIM